MHSFTHTNAVEALTYFAECAAATVEYLASIKRKTFSDFARHVVIAKEMIRAAMRYGGNEMLLKATSDRLNDAIREHNSISDKKIEEMEEILT